MFGTSGIRGIYGKDITEELAYKVSNIFAEGKIAVGRDLRESGRSLFSAVCKGAFSAGAEVIDLGVVPTPTVALATNKHHCRGFMITASHNPPEYNGLKLIENGKEIGKPLEKEITKRYGSGESKRGGRETESTITHDRAIIENHKEMVFSLVDRDRINRKRPKVIVDCNGAAGVITPYLLSDLGCRVTSVNASVECFNRPSEPSADNIAYLAGLVRESRADFAIAHDGDGDRCTVVDDTGAVLPLDVQLAIMIEHELSIATKNKKIISTVEASLTIREAVEKAGGTIDITPVGSTFVADALEDRKAAFGGEPCGEYIYADGVHVPDAVLAAAKFAEIFCLKGTFSKLKTRYPQNFMAREKFQCRDKKAAMERIKGAVSIEGKRRTDDGIRIDENDGWFLIRASGTEPIVRLTMEYKTKERLEERKAKLRKMISDSI